MTERAGGPGAPLSLAFFDPDRGVHGALRAGMTLLFRRDAPPEALGGAEVGEEGNEYRAAIEERLDLSWRPVSETAALGGSRVRVCEVGGTVGGQPVEGLGTVSEAVRPPAWEELDAVRSVSALFGPGDAALLAASRPRGALGHGAETVAAVLVVAGELVAVEEARISTVYDGDGRQRSAGLELWLPGEDFPRRAAGAASAGTTAELPGLRLNAAVFEWRMEGRAGAGAYELTTRDEPPEAA